MKEEIVEKIESLIDDLIMKEEIVEKIESLIDDLIKLLEEITENHGEFGKDNISHAILNDGLAAGCILSSAACLQSYVDSYNINKGNK